MRNGMEAHMLNMIENGRQRAAYKVANPVVKPVLSNSDKAAIQSCRDSISHKARKPIFDRTKLPMTLGQMVMREAAKQESRFTGFGQMIQAEMQKVGVN